MHYSGNATCVRAPKKCQHIIGKTGQLFIQQGYGITFKIFTDNNNIRDFIQTTPVKYCWRRKDNRVIAITASGSMYRFSVK